jgi:H+/Cl- antiporter ClcA
VARWRRVECAKIEVVVLALCLMKLVSTVFCYSSGGAGRILASALFIGGMLGGAFGYADVALFHHDPSEIGAFALVGMGAAFAGIIRAPITSVCWTRKGKWWGWLARHGCVASWQSAAAGC